MATASCLLSEETLLCPVCLDVLTEPVSTPCGHSFCNACIHKYWGSKLICNCPLCKREFSPRPELQVNSVISELVAEFKALSQAKPITPDQEVHKTEDVLCDICSGLKEKAVKSCLMCLVSFCEAHLEPHQRVASLRCHTLVDPLKSLDDRMCKMHSKIRELFCRTDQECVCALCFKTKHKGHDVVSLEEEYESVVAKKDQAVADIRKMIESRSKKIAEIENSVDEAAKQKIANVQFFEDMILCIQRKQAEFVDVIEERFSELNQKAGGFITELKTEVAELESRSDELEQLSVAEDHQRFLQSFPALCAPLKTDWTGVSVHADLSFEKVKGALTHLKETFDELVGEIKMGRLKEHAVDLTFDPDTACCSLLISQDGKQVRKGKIKHVLPNNPKRFVLFPDVLAKQGFTTGKFYYEVQGNENGEWAVGVVRESFERNSKEMLVEDGYWTLMFDKGTISSSSPIPIKILHKEKLQNVAIFVDYEGGVVSFYDVTSKSHIYSFTGCHFTEKLYPFFYLGGDTIIITLVPHSQK